MFWLIFGIVVTFMVGVSFGMLIERRRVDEHLADLIATNEALEHQCRQLLFYATGGERES